mmetsp:Transcript_3505/g.2530  ORF Transcript_3505/g.2530 Transcript_3505/m.2530 type:complete len:124 (+) Transcript_3505:221-592(+)
MRMRISRLRKDFGSEGISFIERDAAGEQPYGNKPGNNIPISIKKKVLQMGLQAANQIKRFQSQTYFNRSVNKIVQYDPSDFIREMQKHSQQEQSMQERLDKFIERAGDKVESALQSNELINVF